MTTRTSPHLSPRDDATDLGTAGGGPWRRRFAVGVAAILVLPSWGIAAAQPDDYALLRSHMVEQQIRKRGIEEPAILSAMERVPRHLFVPETSPPQAYGDAPVEFAPGQTLPQAYLTAQMVELLDLNGDEKVLEIGTGSGYDAAILSRLAREVYTIDIVASHVERAREVLRRLGYTNIHVRTGDGHQGWPEKAPFDAILLTAAPETIPDGLFDQLAEGGKMVVAVGGEIAQDLQVITMTADGPQRRLIKPVVMEPMIEPERE